MHHETRPLTERCHKKRSFIASSSGNETRDGRAYRSNGSGNVNEQEPCKHELGQLVDMK